MTLSRYWLKLFVLILGIILLIIGVCGTIYSVMDYDDNLSCKIRSEDSCKNSCDCAWCEFSSTCLNKNNNLQCNGNTFIIGNCKRNPINVIIFSIISFIGIIMSFLSIIYYFCLNHNETYESIKYVEV